MSKLHKVEFVPKEGFKSYQILDEQELIVGVVAGIENEKYANLFETSPELLEAMIEFCDRVDKGEVRSTKTYNKFKTLIDKVLDKK